MNRPWKIGDVVKLFDGAYSTGTIVRAHTTGPCAGTFDVARPYLHATETGGYSTGVEVVSHIRGDRLTPAETGRDGNPRNMLHGVYTWEDLKKAQSGEWKL